VLNGPLKTQELTLLMVVSTAPLLLLAVPAEKNVTDTLYVKFKSFASNPTRG